MIRDGQFPAARVNRVVVYRQGKSTDSLVALVLRLCQMVLSYEFDELSRTRDGISIQNDAHNLSACTWCLIVELSEQVSCCRWVRKV